VRTHLGAEDAAFQCMGAGEDGAGLPGVFLRKSVLEVAARALAQNLARLAPALTPQYLQARARLCLLL
jgi:3-ketoacyl-CoA synthase